MFINFDLCLSPLMFAALVEAALPEMINDHSMKIIFVGGESKN